MVASTRNLFWAATVQVGEAANAVMLFEKTHAGGQPPRYGRNGAAGIDISPCISHWVKPHSTTAIRTGLRVLVTSHLALDVIARSSYALSGRLQILTGLVDPVYAGELIVIAYNPSSTGIILRKGEYFAQLIPRIMPTITVMFDPCMRARSTLEVAERYHHPYLEELVQRCRAPYQSAPDKPAVQVADSGPDWWAPLKVGAPILVPPLTAADIRSTPLNLPPPVTTLPNLSLEKYYQLSGGAGFTYLKLNRERPSHVPKPTENRLRTGWSQQQKKSPCGPTV